MKHTPGPWEVSRGAQNHPYSIEGSTKTVAFIKMQLELETTIDNANLIAAAPEMLDMLEICYRAEMKARWENKELLTIGGITKLKNIIKKAKGEP